MTTPALKPPSRDQAFEGLAEFLGSLIHQPQFLTLAEAAELLGVSGRSVQRFVGRNPKVVRRIGRSVRYERTALVALVGRGR